MDFSYAERLALYDNGRRYAYINLLNNKTYDDFLMLVSRVMNNIKKKDALDFNQVLDNNLFSIACDKINGTEVLFDMKKKCEKCGSDCFDDYLLIPEEVEEVDLPIITYNKWNMLSDEKKMEMILNSIK